MHTGSNAQTLTSFQNTSSAFGSTFVSHHSRIFQGGSGARDPRLFSNVG